MKLFALILFAASALASSIPKLYGLPSLTGNQSSCGESIMAAFYPQSNVKMVTIRVSRTQGMESCAQVKAAIGATRGLGVMGCTNTHDKAFLHIFISFPATAAQVNPALQKAYPGINFCCPTTASSLGWRQKVC